MSAELIFISLIAGSYQCLSIACAEQAAKRAAFGPLLCFISSAISSTSTRPVAEKEKGHVHLHISGQDCGIPTDVHHSDFSVCN